MTIRFAENRFRESYLPTLGVDFLTKTVIINNKTAKLQLWDTGGQEFVKALLPFYFSGAAGGALVFDLTDRNSFNSLGYWLKQIRKNSGDIPVVLAGNKVDLAAQRKVTTEEGQIFASKNDLLYLETSAKTGVSVPDLFKNLVQIIVEEQEKKEEEKSQEPVKTETEMEEQTFFKRVNH